MTKSNSWEVLWSPSNPNKFIKFDKTDVSSDILLYQVYRNQVSAAPIPVFLPLLPYDQIESY